MATDPVGFPIDRTSTAEILTMRFDVMLQAVQANKALLLEDLLKDQMLVLQQKNDQVAAQNSLMAHINSILTRFGKDATPTTTLTPPLTAEQATALIAAITGAGDTFSVIFPGFSPSGTDALAKSHFESAATQVKSIIDNLSNAQQMDMLRVQSISNKRNEAFELMTTFIKKFNDLMSAIIRNIA